MDRIDEAKTLFNETWDLMDMPQRTPDEDCLMLHKAHTSCYLWKSAENPVNDARGEWQVSRVYSVLGMGAPALLHANRSLALCLEHNAGGLDLVFGYEAVARAQALLGNAALALAAKTSGIQACAQVEGEQDRTYALGELNSIDA